MEESSFLLGTLSMFLRLTLLFRKRLDLPVQISTSLLGSRLDSDLPGSVRLFFGAGCSLSIFFVLHTCNWDISLNNTTYLRLLCDTELFRVDRLWLAQLGFFRLNHVRLIHPAAFQWQIVSPRVNVSLRVDLALRVRKHFLSEGLRRRRLSRHLVQLTPVDRVVSELRVRGHIDQVVVSVLRTPSVISVLRKPSVIPVHHRVTTCRRDSIQLFDN